MKASGARSNSFTQMETAGISRLKADLAMSSFASVTSMGRHLAGVMRIALSSSKSHTMAALIGFACRTHAQPTYHDGRTLTRLVKP